jgi:hypothetical protein
VTWLNREYVLQRRNDEAEAKLLQKIDAVVAITAKATSKAKKLLRERRKLKKL